ncbi:hypothetical protein M231_02866 [Tremella mesenterica]|uniref:Uncharacterized protein n=1 Tax=Tremella mesenterica TaxID=5217 RepID=A0A4Q1BPI4_TREME|nr:hypothetical protein M231_02866 [Tremella mesenterica]
MAIIRFKPFFLLPILTFLSLIIYLYHPSPLSSFHSSSSITSPHGISLPGDIYDITLTPNLTQSDEDNYKWFSESRLRRLSWCLAKGSCDGFGDKMSSCIYLFPRRLLSLDQDYR